MRNAILYLRFLSRHKTLSIINICGFSIGIATCIFIGLYIAEELSYDQYHENIDRIFSVTTKLTTEESLDHLATASLSLAPELKLNYPEVEEAVRLYPVLNPTVRYEGIFFKEKDIYQADQEIFEVFTYHLLKGNPKTALTGSHSMVITKSFGIKYFGQGDPINRTILVNDREFQITAVLEDTPDNSDLKFSALLSIDKSHEEDWFWDFGYYTYVLFDGAYLKSDPTANLFEKKLVTLADRKLNEAFRSSNQSTRMNLFIEPFKDVHFREPLYADTPKANIKYLYIFASVALLMLLIGSLNFINFSLVQSLERRKEVGIRKIIGARYRQLVLRYLGESILMTVLSFAIAILLVGLTMPWFNEVSGKTFQITDLISLTFFIYALPILLLTGTLAGGYPAFFTSSIPPLQSLKGKLTGLKGNGFQKISIMAQFAIAIGLTISTVLTYRQMQFVFNFDLGFRRSNIIVLDTPVDTRYSGKLNAFKESLLRNANVRKVSNLGYSAVPGENPNKSSIRTKVDGEAKIINFSWVDEDYLPTLDIALSRGRNFDLSNRSDKENAVIVNEAFVKLWGWDHPLNETIQWQGKSVNVIGVIKDFHFSSLYKTVEPHFLVINNKEIVNTLVRFDSTYAVSKQLDLLDKEWKMAFPDQPIVYRFLDEPIAAQYASEERAITVFSIFSFLTILVSCLGLFGLCSLTISQRKKEVGIRKVMGAGFTAIVYLFSKEYLSLIGWSFLVIAPLAFSLYNYWVESFPYKESVSIFVFIATGIGVIGLGLFTIIVGIAKTTKTNPCDLLRE